jgi:hypothetical protein
MNVVFYYLTMFIWKLKPSFAILGLRLKILIFVYIVMCLQNYVKYAQTWPEKFAVE